MLLRAGVQRLRLIDFDQVTLSSLNRHAVAVRNDVGIPKVECMKRHLLEIMPLAQIETFNCMFDSHAAPELLHGQPDFVLGTTLTKPLQAKKSD
jgi:tRNA A37 threonylcarbamoyladenosine dehydratase